MTTTVEAKQRMMEMSHVLKCKDVYLKYAETELAELNFCKYASEPVRIQARVGG